MKVIILCGGKGIRAFPFTEYLPKPMLPIGGSPILMHIIRSYMEQGFHEFVLAAGHRKAVLDDYFADKNIGANIEIIDTGDHADTGERIFACRHLVSGTFMVTYGDGLSDVLLADVLAHHRHLGALGTMTCVPMYSPYGVVEIAESGLISQLREKPVLREKWINAGFFVFEEAVFENWRGTNLERDVIHHLIHLNRMAAYRHDGFFKSMDSYKDQQEFEELYFGTHCPWKTGNRP